MAIAYDQYQRVPWAKKQSSSDGYIVQSRTHTPSPVKEGDVRYNSTIKQNERYSPEGKWIPIGKKTIVPPTENKTNRAKEWGLGQK